MLGCFLQIGRLLLPILSNYSLLSTKSCWHHTQPNTYNQHLLPTNTNSVFSEQMPNLPLRQIHAQKETSGHFSSFSSKYQNITLKRQFILPDEFRCFSQALLSKIDMPFYRSKSVSYPTLSTSDELLKNPLIRNSACGYFLLLEGEGEGKGKVVCVHATKAFMGSRGVAPLIHNLGNRWRWMVTFKLCEILFWTSCFQTRPEYRS